MYIVHVVGDCVFINFFLIKYNDIIYIFFYDTLLHVMHVITPVFIQCLIISSSKYCLQLSDRILDKGDPWLYLVSGWNICHCIEGFLCFFLSCKAKMPVYNSQRRGTARTSQISYFLIVMYVSLIFWIVLYVTFCVLRVLFVCKCILYCCHRVSTKLQLNIYHILLYNIILFKKSYHIIYPSTSIYTAGGHMTGVLNDTVTTCS
jgi:hypothetical protein